MGLGQTVAASVPAPLLESECQLSLVDARVAFLSSLSACAHERAQKRAYFGTRLFWEKLDTISK